MGGQGSRTVGSPCLDGLPVDHFPSPNASILRCGQKDVSVRPPGQVRNFRFVPDKRIKGVSGSRFPDVQPSVPVGACKQNAIRRKGYLSDPFGVLLYLVKDLATCQVENLYELGRSSDCD